MGRRKAGLRLRFIFVIWVERQTEALVIQTQGKQRKLELKERTPRAPKGKNNRSLYLPKKGNQKSHQSHMTGKKESEEAGIQRIQKKRRRQHTL